MRETMSRHVLLTTMWTFLDTQTSSDHMYWRRPIVCLRRLRLMLPSSPDVSVNVHLDYLCCCIQRAIAPNARKTKNQPFGNSGIVAVLVHAFRFRYVTALIGQSLVPLRPARLVRSTCLPTCPSTSGPDTHLKCTSKFSIVCCCFASSLSPHHLRRGT